MIKMPPSAAELKFNEILIERLEIFSAKNRDYGDSYKVDGVIGIVIRLGDKLKRLKQITQDGYQVQVKDEGLEELLGDIANYSLMGLMCIRDAEKEADNSGNEQEFVQQGKDDNPKPAFEHSRACTCARK
jgi:hypothetical protein